jgi:hypothetical protein
MQIEFVKDRYGDGMQIQKKTLVGAAIFTLLNIVWFFVFSKMNMGFFDLFDYNIFLNLMNLNIFFLLLLTSIIIAGAISIMFITASDDKKQNLILFGAGGGTSVVIAFIIFNSLISMLFALAFIFSCLLAICTFKIETTSVFSKMKFGWGAARKVGAFFAIGALMIALFFTLLNKEVCEQKTKESISKFAARSVGQAIDMASLISKDDLKNLLCSSVTREGVAKTAEAQLGDMWNTLTEEQKNKIIDDSYAKSLESCSNDAYLNQAYATLQQNLNNRNISFVSESTIEKIMEQLPIMKTILQILPIISAIMLFSGINLFMTAFVAPFVALISLVHPRKENLQSSSPSLAPENK